MGDEEEKRGKNDEGDGKMCRKLELWGIFEETSEIVFNYLLFGKLF